MSDERTCPLGKCDGSGWVLVDPDDGPGNTVRMCECERQRQRRVQLERLFGQANIPRRYAGQTLAKLDPGRQPVAMKAAREYAGDWNQVRAQGRWLFLSGPVGTGKTALAYGILQELLTQGVSGLAETVPELMDHLRPGRDDQSYERLEALKTIDLLVLDDLGAQKDTDWVTERLFIILDARYREMRPTILTSNEHLESLERVPGWKRIVDRILESAQLLRMTGPSRRVETARERLTVIRGGGQGG